MIKYDPGQVEGQITRAAPSLLVHNDWTSSSVVERCIHIADVTGSNPVLSTMSPTIFKNSLWLFSAQTVVKIISFLYTIFLARSLGVDNFGIYTAALAYFALFSSLADFGFNRYLIREGAQSQDRLHQLVWSTVCTRLAFVSVLFMAFSILLWWLDPDSLRVGVSLLAIIAVLPQSIAFTFDAVLVAKEKLWLSSIGLLILSIVTTVAGFYFVTQGLDVIGAVTALVIGESAYMFGLWWILRRQQMNFQLHISWKDIQTIISGSLPYGLLAVLGLVYFRIDSLMLSYMRGSYETGLYGAAYRFLEAVVFIPSALATAMFPVLSRLHEKNNAEVKKLYFSSLRFLAGLSVVVLGGFLFVLPMMVLWLLPQYAESIEALKILSWTIPFLFLHVAGTIVLLSSQKYLKEVIQLSLLTVGFNIVANLLIIPRYGFIGASYVTVASEALSFFVFFGLIYYRLLRHD